MRSLFSQEAEAREVQQMVEAKESAARQREEEARQLQEQLEETRRNMEQQQEELVVAQEAAKQAALMQSEMQQRNSTSHVMHVDEYEMNDDADEYGESSCGVWSPIHLELREYHTVRQAPEL